MSTPLPGVSFTNEFLLISAAVGVLLIGLLAAFSDNIGVMSETLGRINEVRLEILNEKIDVISADRDTDGDVRLVLTNYGTTASTILAVIDADGNQCNCTGSSTIAPGMQQELDCPIPNSFIHDNILIITEARNILDVNIHRLNGSVPSSVPSSCASSVSVPVSQSQPTSPPNTPSVSQPLIPDPQDPSGQPSVPNVPLDPPNPPNNPQTPVKSSPIKQIIEPSDSHEFNPVQNSWTIDLNTYADNKIRIDIYNPLQTSSTRYYDNDASITIFRNTEIIHKLFNAQGNQYCYVGDLRVGQDTEIPQDHITALQIEFRRHTDSSRCHGSPSIDFSGKLFLDKTIYVRFDGQVGKTPFYYDGSNMNNIPKCDDKNFNKKKNDLKRKTELCYGRGGDNGEDIVIVSKILATFGVKCSDCTSPRSESGVNKGI